MNGDFHRFPLFDGASVKNQGISPIALMDMLSSTVRVADMYASDHPAFRQNASWGAAAAAAVQSVNALLRATVAQCHLSNPDADIEMKLNAAGKLIYRCRHQSPNEHEWDLSGNRIK